MKVKVNFPGTAWLALAVFLVEWLGMYLDIPYPYKEIALVVLGGLVKALQVYLRASSQEVSIQGQARESAIWTWLFR